MYYCTRKYHEHTCHILQEGLPVEKKIHYNAVWHTKYTYIINFYSKSYTCILLVEGSNELTINAHVQKGYSTRLVCICP